MTLSRLCHLCACSCACVFLHRVRLHHRWLANYCFFARRGLGCVRPLGKCAQSRAYCQVKRMLGDICAVPRPCSLVGKEAAQDVEEEEGVDEMFVADERGGFLKSPSRHIIATACCGLSVQPGKETEEGAGDSETTRVGGLGDGCLPDVSSVLASPDLSAAKRAISCSCCCCCCCC